MIIKLAIQVKKEHILEDQKRFKVMAKHLKELMKDDKEALEKNAFGPDILGHIANGISHIAPQIGQFANHGMVSPVLDFLHSGGALGTAAAIAGPLAIGSSFNNLPKMLLRRGNSLSTMVNKSTLADGVVALKKASQGHVLSNDTVLGVMAHGMPGTQAKTMALSGFNREVAKHPFIAEAAFHKDRPNLLNTDIVRQHLSQASEIKDQINKRVEQGKQRVSARVNEMAGFLPGSEELAKQTTDRLGRYTKLTNKALAPVHNLLDQATAAHEVLNRQGGHGYEMLRGGALKAETALERPAALNIVNKLYQPADKPSTGIFSKVRNLTMNGILGQHKDAGVSRVEAILHGHPEDRISDAAKDLAARRGKEGMIVKKLEAIRRTADGGEMLKDVIHPTGTRGDIQHADVVESLRSGKLLGKTKEILSTPTQSHQSLYDRLTSNWF